MKNIAIFCDGTWQSLGQPFPTNVALVARAVAANKEQYPQLIYYDDGVGVGEGVLNSLVRLIGGATGAGLDQKIIHAYRFLCLNYEPGDHLFIFGFSRGAYTARSLSGLLRKLWILRRDQIDAVGEALELYRRAALDEQVVRSFRRDHCYDSAPMLAQRVADPHSAAAVATQSAMATVQYVGVWDTVGSLGIPHTLPFATRLDRRYEFHDLNLSRFVVSARHAVSIDECRASFLPSLWENVAALNANANAARLPYGERPYQQVWFPGRHPGVGGGQDDGGLSLSPLAWVAEGAARAGLTFDETMLDAFRKHADPLAPFVPESGTLVARVLRMTGRVARKGPDDLDEVSDPARLRWRGRPDYRPVALTKVKDRL